jgi:hypothetical protein
MIILQPVSSSESSSQKSMIIGFMTLLSIVLKNLCIVSKVQSIKFVAPCGTLKVQRTITLHSLKIMESFDNRFTSQVDFNAKKTIDRSVNYLCVIINIS